MTTNFPGIENLETVNGTIYRCESCGSTLVPSEFATGKQIRHARSCATKAQPYAAAPVRFAPAASPRSLSELSQVSREAREAIRNGAIGAVMTDEEIVDAYRAGLISGDDAMNRDF